MTTELHIRFNKSEDNIQASVHFNNADTERLPFVNPLQEKELTNLRWYIERYWQWPVGPDYDRAQGIERDLPQVGKRLFNAVFKQSADAMRLFERFNERRGADALVTIDTTVTEVLGLPWELLADEGGYLFSKNPPISIRRRMHTTRDLKVRQFELPVRVLMVISRPDGSGFMDPRSSARPLLDALATLGEQVQVEFLRPPTLTALTRRLRDRHLPPVHLVHFDGHGVYDSGVGLGFLLFENEKHEPDKVDAERLGTLLNECGIPLMILDACQTAEADERNPFSSVATRLIESGVGGVVAMNYSVLVETAKRLTGHFYTALARGDAVSTALDMARFELLADTQRFKLYRSDQKEETIHLQDWFVPALYQQEQELRPFPAHLPGAGSQTSVKPAQADPAIGRAALPPEPQYGFHGRARELLALERAFAEHDSVVLHGFGGQGKTTLAAEAGRWLTRTGQFKRAAFVSFEGGAGLEVVLSELGNALVSDNFAIHQGNPVEAIAQALADTPTLVIWDNLETILPNGEIALPAEALKELLDAGAHWAGQGGSRLLLTTRDDALPHSAFQPGKRCRHLPLTGLTSPDALDLAGTILEDLNLPRPPRASLERLMNFLGNHPLSIQLSLPALRQAPDVDKIIAEFDTLLPGFTQGAGQKRSDSLEISLRFSIRRLSAEAQALLPRLAVFQGGAWEQPLLRVTEIDKTIWETLMPVLAHAALIRIEDVGVGDPFIHFHPTLVPHLNRQPETQALLADGTLRTRYWQEYYELANALYRIDDKNPIQARVIAAREMPNLRHALTLALKADALDEAVDFADRINRFLDIFGRWRERDEITALVEKSQATRAKNSDGRLTRAEYLMETQRGERLWQQGRAGPAEHVFRALLGRLENASYDAGFHHSQTLGRIGRCLESQGRPAAAAEHFRAALRAAEALKQTPQLQGQISRYHTDLADVLTDLGQFAAAEQEYQTSLELKRPLNDERGNAVVLGQLGNLALAQNKLADARARYTEALQTFRGLGERQSEAIIWHQLGRIAQGTLDWAEAERCYKESLILKEQLNDVVGAAQTCNQLANVAKNDGRPDEAERWYRRAIKLGEAIGNPKELGIHYYNLANLLLAQDRLDEAEDCAQRARAIDETLDLSAEPWKDYSILAKIAEKRGQADAALEWRRKARDTFAAFPGSDIQIEQHKPLISAVISVAQGNVEERAEIEAAFDQLTANGWMIADGIKRIWAGERDLNALTDDLYRTNALIIRRILEGLAVSVPGTVNSSKAESVFATSTASEPQAEESDGLTLPQLLDLVEQAACGDTQLGERLYAMMQELTTQSDEPITRALGIALRTVLEGGRDPDLGDLPPETASAVRGMLGRLRNP